MAEAGKVISEMLLARLNNGTDSNGSTPNPKPNNVSRDIPLPPSQTVVYREGGGRSNRTALHASDRRSYIERENDQQARPQALTNTNTDNKNESILLGVNKTKNASNNIPNDNDSKDTNKPIFSISVKPLGGGKGNQANAPEPLCPKSEEVVSQLLKDGKHPVCSECKQEIPP